MSEEEKLIGPGISLLCGFLLVRKSIHGIRFLLRRPSPDPMKLGRRLLLPTSCQDSVPEPGKLLGEHRGRPVIFGQKLTVLAPSQGPNLAEQREALCLKRGLWNSRYEVRAIGDHKAIEAHVYRKLGDDVMNILALSLIVDGMLRHF